MNKIVLVTGPIGSIGQALSYDLEQHGFTTGLRTRSKLGFRSCNGSRREPLVRSASMNLELETRMVNA